MKTTLILDWFWMYPDNYPHPPHIMITVSVAQLGWAVNRRIVTTPYTSHTAISQPHSTALGWGWANTTYIYNHFSSSATDYWLLSTDSVSPFTSRHLGPWSCTRLTITLLLPVQLPDLMWVLWVRPGHKQYTCLFRNFWYFRRRIVFIPDLSSSVDNNALNSIIVGFNSV